MDILNEGILSLGKNLKFIQRGKNIWEENVSATNPETSYAELVLNGKPFTVRSQYCRTYENDKQKHRIFQWTFYKGVNMPVSLSEELFVEIFPDEPQEVWLIHNLDDGDVQLTFNGKEIPEQESNSSKRRKMQTSDSQHFSTCEINRHFAERTLTRFILQVYPGTLDVRVICTGKNHAYILLLNGKLLQF